MSALFSLSLPTPSHFNKGKWSPAEDDQVRSYVAKFGEKKWKKISDLMSTRNPLQCLHRWTKILKPGMIKGPWTIEEDQKLAQWVRVYGANKWSLAARMIPGRNGKQCRERWINHLNPDIKKGNWTEAEDEKIYQLYQRYGSAWSKIARHFIGRSENSIKNRFYATLRKFDHIKRRSEVLGLAKLETVENQSISNCTTTETSPEKVVKVEHKETLLEASFNENLFNFTENNWGLEESEESTLCKQESCSMTEEKLTGDAPMNQENVMEILNVIMEDDKKLDDKILNMIDCLKNIELQLMDKITKSMKGEGVKQEELKRSFEELEEEDDLFDEFFQTAGKKVRLI